MMTTTYELYTNENGTPKAVEGKAPAIIERVEALEETFDNGVVTSVNGNAGDITPEQTGCLPLSGGTMTGAIVSSSNHSLVGASSSSKHIICGGTNWADGSHIILGGKDSDYDGALELVAKNGGNEYRLYCSPTGRFQWNGKDVFTSAGGEVSGVIVNACGDIIQQKTTNSYTSFKGGTNNDTGGHFTTYGKDHANKGMSIIGAYDGTNGILLRVLPNGTADLGGSRIPTLANPFVPNYSAGVAISSGYTAPSAGVVCVRSLGSFSGYTWIRVNGVEVSQYKTTAQMDSYCFAWVGKGDIVTYQNGGGSPTAYFYPLKIGG